MAIQTEAKAQTATLFNCTSAARLRNQLFNADDFSLINNFKPISNFGAPQENSFPLLLLAQLSGHGNDAASNNGDAQMIEKTIGQSDNDNRLIVQITNLIC